MDWTAIPLGLFPVILFLAALRFLDSFKLVTHGATVLSIGIGALAALASLLVNVALIDYAGMELSILRRYAAPAAEEILKAAYLVILVRSARVGFVVDSAIHGFALGTGFAVIENIYYAFFGIPGGVGLWLVRGLGTAVMHGSTTAMVGIIGKALADRRGSAAPALFLPGLVVAYLIHSFYNHLVLDPLVATALLLVAMPLLLVVIFERSERATREWLGAGMDGDVEMLESIISGEVTRSHVGTYLESLRRRFSGTIVADMLCYLQIHLELALRAKGILLAREAGIEVHVGDDVRSNFEELKFLERSIGPTGVLAVHPLLRTSSRDLWQIYMIGDAARAGGAPGRRPGRAP